jgi:hypothetical protein
VWWSSYSSMEFDSLRVVVLLEMVLYVLLLRLIAMRVCAACSKTRNKSVPITYLNKYAWVK